MSLRHKLKTVCLILLVLFLVGSSVPSAQGDPDPSGLNFSLTVFEDTGTAGDRSDDTKISFSGLYSATYSTGPTTLSSSRTQLATRFTKLGEINKVRVCWQQGTSVSGTVYIRIETDAAGPYPSGTLADADAQISVSASTLPDSQPEWTEYTFPGAVTLSESNWYWIVLKYEPGGSETIEVSGSYAGSDLPSNINLGGYYTDTWYTSTSLAYVAFLIPETTHSLPLYRRTNLDADLPVSAGWGHIAELPNDVNKVYRIVMQIQPKVDEWKWAPDDGAATDYYIRDAGSTPSATDIWDSDNAARPQFILQTSAGNGAKDDVFISGDEASEWDGTSSITLTECGDLNDASDPDAAGEMGIYPYDGTQWWDAINDAIALDNWQVIEFWFKLDDDWSNGDVAELRYSQEAEGGHTNLYGLRYRLHVGVHKVDTYDSDYTTPKGTFLNTETVYAKATVNDDLIGWLSGWRKRVKLTIDAGDVDSDLSDFPVVVHLSTSSGRLGDDVSFVFDELGGDENRTKIAVTKSDGTTECYVEIEKWDHASEEAWLWVRVSGTNSISSTTDTDLYLYYDKEHADNTAYVGDTDSTAAENVWDDYFKGVWHLHETNGATPTQHDSTSNNNDGTPTNTEAGDFGVSAKVDGAELFDGVNDYVDVSYSSSLDITGDEITIAAWANFTNTFDSGETDDQTLIDGGGKIEYWFDASDGKLTFAIDTGGWGNVKSTRTSWTAGTWYHVVAVYDGSNRYIYIDGAEDNSNGETGNLVASAMGTHISNPSVSTNEGPYDGIYDEVRISNVSRSPAWVKASYNSESDDLIDFGSEESRSYDFKYYSDWGGPSEALEYQNLNVAEDPAGEWRNSQLLDSGDPTGTWGVEVFETGTSNLLCSCSFTVTSAVPEFHYGAVVALVTGFAFFLVKRKTAMKMGKES